MRQHAVRRRTAAHHGAGTGRDRFLDQAVHPPHVRLVDQRPHLGGRVGRRTHPHRPQTCRQRVAKLAGDPALRQQPAAGHAEPAGEHRQRIDQHRHDRGEVGIVEHDHRRLAAELQPEPLHPRRGVGGDGAACRGTAGEADDRHVGRDDQGIAGFLAAGEQVDHATRQLVRLGDDLGDQRVHLGGLGRQHHGCGASRGQCRCQRADHQRHRRVPWRDDAGHPGRLAQHHGEPTWRTLGGAASSGERECRVEAQRVGRDADFQSGMCGDLAVLAAEQPHEIVRARLEAVGQAIQHARAQPVIVLPAIALEGSLGRGDRVLRLCGPRQRVAADDGAGRGVDTVGRLAPSIHSPSIQCRACGTSRFSVMARLLINGPSPHQWPVSLDAGRHGSARRARTPRMVR